MRTFGVDEGLEFITSAKNPLMQHIRRLLSSRSYREETGEFAAEGWKLLDEALHWYPQFTAVVVTQGAPLPLLPPQTRVVAVPESLMQSISAMRTPQGVVFALRLPQPPVPALHPGMLLLDRIQDPGNLGTILRTADAFDVPVLLTNGCADPFSEKTVRASMGAVLRTPPQTAQLSDILEQCREKKINLAVTALTPQARDIRKVSFENCIAVIGSEGQGICSELLEASQMQVIIPMSPRCESLNAAVAAALVMWEMRN